MARVDQYHASCFVGNSASVGEQFEQRRGSNDLVNHGPRDRADNGYRLAGLLFNENGDLRMSDQAVFNQELFHFFFELEGRQSRPPESFPGSRDTDVSQHR